MRRSSKSPHINAQQTAPNHSSDTGRSASPRPVSLRPSFASSAVTKEHLNAKPWRYLGYRGFSTFTASDNDFFILRRFGTLHARVLLSLQDRITVLEINLRAIDEDASRDDDDYDNGTFREDRFQDRVLIIDEIQKKLEQYNKLVLQHSLLRARPGVPIEDVQSVVTWLENKGTAIATAEVQYLNHASDLFQLVSKNKSWLRRFLERSDLFRTFPMWRRPSPSLCEDAIVDDEYVHYHDDAKIEHAVAVIILTVGVVMIVSPLWILEFIHGSTKRLGIITLFIVLFISLLSVATVAKPFESLAAAAAYSAVLIVFLQIAPSG